MLTKYSRRNTKPGLKAKKTEHIKMQKEFTDDVLSVYTVSSLKAVRHRYIFCIYGVLGISVCSPGLVYLGRMCGSASRRLSGARGQIN